jgi:hypothetical protein
MYFSPLAPDGTSAPRFGGTLPATNLVEQVNALVSVVLGFSENSSFFCYKKFPFVGTVA